jgi:prephenate dehydrogenase
VRVPPSNDDSVRDQAHDQHVGPAQTLQHRLALSVMLSFVVELAREGAGELRSRGFCTMLRVFQ